MAAIEESVPADVLTASLFARFRSRQEHTFAEKLLSAMRHKFGGHVERPAGGEMSVQATVGQGQEALAGAGRPAPPCTVVIFGAAGDLTKRKLVPALYNLSAHGLLPREFAIVGVARRDQTTSSSATS